MDYHVKQIGSHRGAPRLYFDTPMLRRAGFAPGCRYDLIARSGERHLALVLSVGGSRVVARKARGRLEVPVIDINSKAVLDVFAGLSTVRIVLLNGALHILALASHVRAQERVDRLLAKVAAGQTLTTASLSFGGGIAAKALHDGMSAAGVTTTLVVANEIDSDYLDLASLNHPLVTAETTLLAAPMQEVAADDWLLQKLPKVDILEAGLPCSGASRAGVSKRHLAKMEDHPAVGHLVATAIVLIARLQPAVVVIENVDAYAASASAEILRKWLRDAGYVISEVVLDARGFDSLEARVRWFLIAHPAEVDLKLSELEQRSTGTAGCLGDVLENIAGDDERFRRVEYLHAKSGRDAAAGKGFAMQLMKPSDVTVPTLRKGYAKGGSTDPRLLHPTDATRSRLLTAREHARIKGIDPTLLHGASETMGHQLCGQSVDTRPVVAVGRQLAYALKAACVGEPNLGTPARSRTGVGKGQATG